MKFTRARPAILSRALDRLLLSAARYGGAVRGGVGFGGWGFGGSWGVGDAQAVVVWRVWGLRFPVLVWLCVVVLS